MARKISERARPIEICHLRLDYDLARRREEPETMRRIKELNAFLQNQSYISREAESKGQSVDAPKLALARFFGGGSVGPIGALIEARQARGEEIMAASEIETAVRAVAAGTMIKPGTWERVDGGRVPPEWDAKTVRAVQQYKSWANHWSNMAKRHADHLLHCVYAAVIEQRPVRAVAEDLGFGHRRVARAVVAGLRDYAARAGWVDRPVARRWMDEAEGVFQKG
jgi:hypothetical protein